MSSRVQFDDISLSYVRSRRLLNSRQVETRNTLTHVEVRGCQQEVTRLYIRRLLHVEYILLNNLDRWAESICQLSWSLRERNATTIVTTMAYRHANIKYFQKTRRI